MATPAIGWGIEVDERIRRSPRDWVVDALLFLLAIGFTTLTFVDGLDTHLARVPLAVDVTLGGLSCLGVWLRRRWPVGFAVTTIVFSVYSWPHLVWRSSRCSRWRCIDASRWSGWSPQGSLSPRSAPR